MDILGELAAFSCRVKVTPKMEVAYFPDMFPTCNNRHHNWAAKAKWTQSETACTSCLKCRDRSIMEKLWKEKMGYKCFRRACLLPYCFTLNMEAGSSSLAVVRTWNHSGVRYNKQILWIKSGCYNKPREILSADVARMRAWRIGLSRFDQSISPYLCYCL